MSIRSSSGDEFETDPRIRDQPRRFDLDKDFLADLPVRVTGSGIHHRYGLVSPPPPPSAGTWRSYALKHRSRALADGQAGSAA